MVTDKSDTADKMNIRVLRLNQFINIYNHIKQQSDVLKTFDDSREQQHTPASKSSTEIMTESKLYNA